MPNLEKIASRIDGAVAKAVLAQAEKLRQEGVAQEDIDSALAAAAARAKGELEMAKEKDNASVAAQKGASGEASKSEALIKAMAAAFEGALRPIQKSLKEQSEILQSMSEQLEARGKQSDASDASPSVSAEADEDTSVAAKGKDDASDASPSVSAKAKKDDDDDDASPSDASDDDGDDDASAAAMKGKAGTEPSDAHGADADPSEADSEPGKVNKHADVKYGRHSTAHLHAAGDKKFLRKLQAMSDKVEKLEKDNEKLKNKLDAVQAQAEKYAEQVNRRSVSPETALVLSKGDFEPTQMTESGTKLSVGQVDTLLDKVGVQLGPTERMKIKNELFAAGLMDEGRITRTQ